MVKRLKNINLTRKGFNFQYKYALYLILKHLYDQDLTEARIDYSPEGINTSIDILLKLPKKSECRIYEVKTNKKTRGGDNIEIEDILKTLFDLRNAIGTEMGTSKTCLFLHVIDDLETKMDFIKRDFSLYKSRGARSVVNKDDSYGVIEKYNWGVDKSIFNNFVDELDINTEFKYQSIVANKQQTDLDEAIEARIRDFLDKIDIDNHRVDYEIEAIEAELFYVISNFVELDLEIIPMILGRMEKIFVRLDLLQKYGDNHKNRNVIRQNSQNRISNELVQITGISLERKLKTFNAT